ncbi:MAG: lytic transglycosylase domain-containing protein [Acidobacteriota bacterium]
MYRRFFIETLILCLLFSLVSQSAYAQQPSATLKEKEVSTLIERAELHYKQGATALAENDFARMRIHFDRAVDELLMAGIDIHSDTRLRTYYRELVDKIVLQQLSASSENVLGLGQQRYEGSPTKDISRLTDTELEQLATTTAKQPELKVSDFSFKTDLPRPVHQFIQYFTAGKGRRTIETGFLRAGKYRSYAETVFQEEGVPTDLIWLAQVESVWQPVATSVASARGIWQFIPATGSRYGLRQDGWIDERLDPERSTRAAARYLRFLADHYAGDWLLAMAAYNCGENGLDRAIARCGYADFWILRERGFIPQETRNYVPAILAVIAIAKNPEAYGFQPHAEQSWEFERVVVSGGTTLQTAAATLKVPVDTITSLNPELVAGVTPPIGHSLRIPKGIAPELLTELTNPTPVRGYKTRNVVKRKR